MATSFIGTLFKLMQSSVKPMLAYSTMGQMGFMVLQCGLGLFPAAVAHLCWHGLFKAYLFLGSGSAAQEKRQDLAYPPSIPVLILSLLLGILGAYSFALASHKDFFAGNSTAFLVGIAWISGAQLAITILQDMSIKRFLLATMAMPIAGALYGFSVWGISLLLADQNMMVPQPLGIMHIVSFAVLVVAWFCILFWRGASSAASAPTWALKLYVRLINASQAQPKTITASRNNYQF
jgi:NAD(P)H-quinone oxidoreductase subunit 5